MYLRPAQIIGRAMLTFRPIFPSSLPANYKGEPLTVILGGLTCLTERATRIGDRRWRMRCTVTGRTYELTRLQMGPFCGVESAAQLERVA